MYIDLSSLYYKEVEKENSPNAKQYITVKLVKSSTNAISICIEKFKLSFSTASKRKGCCEYVQSYK